MALGRRGRQFHSKTDGLARRKPRWVCLDCTTAYPEKRDSCFCGHSKLHYFPSKAELNRWRVLKSQQDAGIIRDLSLQPAYPIVIHDQKVAAYTADFRYTNADSETIIEDVKGKETDVFKLKKKLVEALYGIKITLIK